MGIFFEWDGKPKVGNILGIAGLSLVVTCGGNELLCNRVDYSSGSRVGVINKLSEKGLFWKTYEGELALEGIVSTGDSVGANVWKFSLDNSARHGEDLDVLFSDLNNYLNSGQKVKLEYNQVILGWAWRGETSYFVQSAKPIEKE